MAGTATDWYESARSFAGPENPSSFSSVEKVRGRRAEEVQRCLWCLVDGGSCGDNWWVWRPFRRAVVSDNPKRRIKRGLQSAIQVMTLTAENS